MLQRVRTDGNRKITVCVDSYESGVVGGRFCSDYQQMESFESLMQFLTGVEAILDDQQCPQSYTVPRKFSSQILPTAGSIASGPGYRGKIATFDVQVLFRQHTSWQGILTWRERKMEQSFRSVLELLLLMDNALRMHKEGVA